MKPVPKAEGLCLAFVHVKPGVILHVQIVVFPSDVCIKMDFVVQAPMENIFSGMIVPSLLTEISS